LQSIQIIDPTDPDGERELTIIGNAGVDRDIKNITPADILSSISYFFNLLHHVGNTDDIDHLGNRRLRSVGELLQNQFRDRKSTRLNSSHVSISYAVFCLKKKK